MRGEVGEGEAVVPVDGIEHLAPSCRQSGAPTLHARWDELVSRRAKNSAGGRD